MFQLFSASDGIHVSLAPEALYQFGPFVFTNAMLYGAMTAVFIFIVMRWAAKNISVKPTKRYFASVIEMMIEHVIGMLSGAFGSREKGIKFAPVFAFFFIFIIFSNILGITPFVSPAFTLGEAHLFRPLTADLNGTIALSVIAIIVVQVLSVKEQGGKKHLQHYFSDKPLNPINFFIGVLEVFGEFIRILSLSLRLFLNTAVGEILIAVFTSMILVSGRTPIAVIPILLFEVLVAYIQAYVFTVLAANYLGIAISHADDHHDETHATEAAEQNEEASQNPRTVPASASTQVSNATTTNNFQDHLSPATLKNRLAGSDG